MRVSVRDAIRLHQPQDYGRDRRCVRFFIFAFIIYTVGPPDLLAFVWAYPHFTAGSTPGKFFYETFGVGGLLETQGMLPQGIAGINKTYIDSKTGPLNMVTRACLGALRTRN